MSGDPKATHSDSVEMPTPTIAPVILSLGIALLALGIATKLTFVFVGGLVLAVGLGAWIRQLLPGNGHAHEAIATVTTPTPKVVLHRRVARLQLGMPGYRLRLPEKVHPISAGIKGGIVGGLIMPIPAMLYGIISGHGIWLPINLLAGMVLPNVDESTRELEQFQPSLLLLGIFIHVTVSLIMGLMYGVLMPTLPRLHRPIAWGALLMPLLWTAITFISLSITNPLVRARIDWPWFIVTQLVFGVIAALVFMRLRERNPISAGIIGGMVGGLLMPIPAVAWSALTGHGVWYPINLLASLAHRHADNFPIEQLEQFHPEWLVGGLVIHAIFSITFGLAFGVVLPKLPTIPAPLAWGGLMLPLLWTALSYGMMGIANPILQQRVDWPWFIASQFVFGIAAAIVVVRSEQIYIPPAGRGPDEVRS